MRDKLILLLSMLKPETKVADFLETLTPGLTAAEFIDLLSPEPELPKHVRHIREYESGASRPCGRPPKIESPSHEEVKEDLQQLITMTEEDYFVDIERTIAYNGKKFDLRLVNPGNGKVIMRARRIGVKGAKLEEIYNGDPETERIFKRFTQWAEAQI